MRWCPEEVGEAHRPAVDGPMMQASADRGLKRLPRGDYFQLGTVSDDQFICGLAVASVLLR